ncbi:MAG: ubiquinol-cytochrome c reductase iron-sulfur subunit [Desulfobulbaceae bacterium]|nr:ubiquinol-cytochrome c reductase iron-sulfur subunit [Desulfobulbaceae bacterium]
MAPYRRSPEKSRRQFLLKYFKWTSAFMAAALFYPLLRFTGYTVKPRPRHITVNRKLAVGGVYTDQEFLLFMLNDGPIAVSRRCTHLGCRVNYLLEHEVIECPCHQSRFTVQGTRISGPAEKPLPTFPVRSVTDNNGETTGYTVTI